MTDNDERASSSGPKKVAFVAMPFGTKATGVLGGSGPTHVDFDAIWERALLPALSKLGYLPIRADNQTGSVIIKDMLEQLVHADLVLADISIPNGNVYYEAGVRHGARETGCVLLRASWSKPLFDLAQITHLPYPFPAREPKQADYRAIEGELTKRIPGLVDSAGPVFTLARFDPGEPQDSRKLKEVFSDVFEFQKRLAAAKLSASANQKSDLRGLIDPALLGELPGYALRDLTVAVRDDLNWGELSALIDALPKNAFDDPFFNEQKAHALAKQGSYYDAIALLETLNEIHGPTPERCGTIGKEFRELAGEERNKVKKRQYVGNAIDAYRRGMELDLNESYCAQNLLIVLVERGRKADKDEAKECATVAKFAARRAAALNPEEEWANSTLAVLAFFEENSDEARARIDAILDKGWTNWKFVGLVQDLETLLAAIDEQKRAPFREMIDEIKQSLPVEQPVLMDDVLPRIRDAAQRYRKFQQVHARPAHSGELIVSTTADGEETTNTAADGDFVVKNLTEAQENYLVGRNKFEARYVYVEDVDDEWKLYDPKGEVLGVEISRDLTAMLGVGEEFFIMAPWGSEQLAREGDMFVAPLPALDEIYRVARKEFDETYKLVEAE